MWRYRRPVAVALWRMIRIELLARDSKHGRIYLTAWAGNFGNTTATQGQLPSLVKT